MKNRLKNHFEEALTLLEKFIAAPENFEKINASGKLMVEAIQNGGKIISCGNGGSMSDAMHFAEELTGRFREDRRAIPAIAISDPSHITCVANDYGFENIFSRFIEAHGQKKDVLLAISTSGNSKNIIHAIDAARKNGMKIIGLTGKDGGAMKELCDIEIRAPYAKYSDRVQEIHIKVIHALIDFVENSI